MIVCLCSFPHAKVKTDMDVLRPPLVYIDGRCYRKNPMQNVSEKDQMDMDDEYIEPIDDQTYEDEICDAFSNIEETENGFRLRMPVPSGFFKYIIGKKGETKKRIENETKTQISIPRQGQKGDIVVNGRERRGVDSAKTRIEVLVDSARQRTPFTHFLSIPINSTEVVNNFDKFKKDVLRECSGDEGLDETIFQVPTKLHVTIGTLVLMDEREIEAAVELLQDCQQDVVYPVLEGQHLVAEVRGLEYMNDDPTAVDVLYAKVTPTDGSERLQQLADGLVDRFVVSGLMARDYDRVKLHITMLNTLMRKDPTGSTEPKRDHRGRPLRERERESFNAANILEHFADYDLGNQHVDTIHLSTRYSKGKDGYYECAGSIQLP